MAKSNAQAWADAEHQILSRLDLIAEYELLGVSFVGREPSSKGWLSCRAIGRTDSTASAGVCVASDGPSLGRYRDFGGGGASLGFWDFAAEHGPYADWRAAREHFAEKAGVKLPKSDDKLTKDDFAFSELTPGVAMLYAKNKSGVTAKSIVKAGGKLARWPVKLSAELQNHLITFAMYGGGLLSTEPIGYHSVEQVAGKIRIYRGKGKQAEYHKTFTRGTPGLMNEFALGNFDQAEIVWLVEGVTDMLAMQAVLDAAFEGEENPREIVTSIGAASYSLTGEIAARFKGKTVYVVGDIDKNGAGLIGAKQKAVALAPIAKEVRVVVLPFAPESPESDIRDYLNAGKTHNDLLALAQAAEIITPEKAALEGAEPHQVILQRLGCVVCGQIEGTEFVEIFSTRLRKAHTIREIDRFSTTKAIMAFGGPACDEVIWDQATDPPPGKHTIYEVRNAIAREAAENYLENKSPIGLGVWNAGEDKLILVGKREADVFDGTMQLNRVEVPFIENRRIEFGSFRWYDRKKLAEFIANAEDTSWCIDVVLEVQSYFEQWDNWKHPSTPELLVGLIAATWTQTIWPWRPHVTVTGSSGSGKSELLEHSLPPIFGGLAEPILKTTEAGLRQQVGNSSKVIIIDEFEEDRNRRKVFDLMRTSNGGKAVIPRGTTSGRGYSSRLNHMIWVGAIEAGLKEAADLNRFIVIDLMKRPKGSPNRIVRKPDEEFALMGLKVLACIVRRWKHALSTWKKLRTEQIGLDGRIVESHAVPVAALAGMAGLPYDSAKAILQKHLAERNENLQSQQESDEEKILIEILQSHIRAKDGTSETVGKLLRGARYTDGSAADLLDAAGIRWVDHDGEEWVFLAAAPIARHLLRTDRDIGTILGRIEGARNHRCRVAGASVRGRLVPAATILQVLASDEADEQQEAF